MRCASQAVCRHSSLSADSELNAAAAVEKLTVEDPTTFSQPWTAALDLKKDARQVQVPEYACHEGNYAMFNILSGARAAERSKK